MRNAEYWDGRYNSKEDPAHKEWHLSYRELESYLEANIYSRWPSEVAPKIAQLGSGLSVRTFYGRSTELKTYSGSLADVSKPPRPCPLRCWLGATRTRRAWNSRRP